MFRTVLTAAALLLALPAAAHHPAADVVDEEIYENIEAMVADTPHAEMVFDDMGGAESMTVTADSVGTLEGLISAGLLEELAALEGPVTTTITLGQDGSATLTAERSMPGVR